MDPITIASLIAMLAGTAMQYKAGSDARDRTNAAAQRGLLEQDALQRQSEQKALATAQNFNQDNRNQQQADLESQANQVLMQPVQAAQEQHAQAATNTGAASSDYVKAKAAADVNTMALARQMAGWMAKTTGANRLRTNEAINLADAASQLGQLSNFAQHDGQVSQLDMQNAARPDMGLTLGGSLLQGAGMMGAAGGFKGLGAASGVGGDIGGSTASGLADADMAGGLNPNYGTLPTMNTSAAYRIPGVLSGRYNGLAG